MKTLTSISAVLAAAALLIGCGEDTDLTGLYQVTYHTYSSDNCEVEGAAETEPPYFRMSKSEFFGANIFSFDGCESAADPECNDFLMVGSSFTQPVDNGWKSTVSYSSFSGGTCSLGFSKGTAILQGGELRIEARAWSETDQIPDAACDPDEAESRGTDMPCDGYEVIVGTLIPE